MSEKSNDGEMKSFKVADVTHLANCVAWALSHMKTVGSGGGVMFNSRTGKMKVWQHDFMDALEKFGIVVDRKKYFAGTKKKK